MERDAAKLDPASTVFESFGASSRARSPRADELGRLAEEARIKTERLKLSTPLGAVDLSRPGGMSNHLVVGASRSASGHPILIGGPQAGYFSPQILLDYELHSPTIHARGAGFPGLSPIVVLGRTQSYAWTPTAGGSDMIDTYVERLCEPGGGSADEDSDHYLFKGQCLPMDRRVLREAATLPGGGVLPEIVVERTVHGPVLARGTLGGGPVAITSKRSSYMKELDAAVSILKMNRNQAKTGEDFVDIFRESHNLSTNWSYANDEEIAYVHGGLYPRRPASVDPDLPVWGTGAQQRARVARVDDLLDAEALGRPERRAHRVEPRPRSRRAAPPGRRPPRARAGRRPRCRPRSAASPSRPTATRSAGSGAERCRAPAPATPKTLRTRIDTHGTRRLVDRRRARACRAGSSRPLGLGADHEARLVDEVHDRAGGTGRTGRRSGSACPRRRRSARRRSGSGRRRARRPAGRRAARAR